MDIRILPMNLTHTAEAARLEASCFSVPWSEESFVYELLGPLNHYFVAMHNEMLVGYCGMQTVLDEGYITNVAVDPAFRHRGIGRLLISALLNTAEQKGLAFVTLEVRQSNEAAIALYSGFGFAPVGLRKNYYTLPVEDAVLMTVYFNPESICTENTTR